MVWQLQEAKSKFSHVVNCAEQDGPQIITRHGKKVAVLVAYDEFEEQKQDKPSLLEALLNSPLAGSGIEIPERDKTDFGRPPIEF